MSNSYEIEFPAYLDEYEMETEAKGYLVDVVVRRGSRQWIVTVYDSTRLAQEIADELSSSAYFALSNVLVVPKVTRNAIDSALAELARSDFADFISNG